MDEVVIILKYFLWFIKSDIELMYETCWYGNAEKIDGFRIYSKKPFSKSYQWCGVIGLEYTYKILSLIQNAIKRNNKAVILEIDHGIGYEKIYIWKGSLRKAEQQIFSMIKEIQRQY